MPDRTFHKRTYSIAQDMFGDVCLEKSKRRALNELTDSLMYREHAAQLLMVHCKSFCSNASIMHCPMDVMAEAGEACSNIASLALGRVC